MGRATINSHLGAGLYSADVVADNEGIDAGIAAATTGIAVQTAVIANIESDLADLDEEGLEADEELNAAILSGDQDAIDAAVKKVALNDTQRANGTRKRSTAVARKFAAGKNKSYYEANRIADDTRQIWAADLTEDLTGEVGLIELGRDGHEPSIIYPASETGLGAAYDDQRDGTNQSPLSNTGPGAVYNYGVSLGVTKWKPRYRTGIISAIENGLADVALDDYVREGVDMNIETELIDVPVSYLDCDSFAFSLSDPVIIEFTDQDWLQPTVIGFVNNPQRCTPRYYLFRAGDYYTVWDLTTDSLADIVDPISELPIPLPATTAQISDWLADQSEVPKEGDLFTRNPVNGIELTLTSDVEGDPIFCIPEPGEEFTSRNIRYDGTSRSAAYTGFYTFDRAVIDPCQSPGFSIDEEFDVEDFDPSLTFLNLGRVITVPTVSNIRPSVYTVATAANNGATYQFTTDYAGTYGGNSDSGEDTSFLIGWNGSVDLVTATPCGPSSGIVDWEYVNFSNLFAFEPPTDGSRRIMQETNSFTEVSYASAAAVQVYIELVRYQVIHGSGPIPDSYGASVICAADTYESKATDVDPLTQTSNAAFTTIINDCLALGFNGTIAGTMSGQYLRD